MPTSHYHQLNELMEVILLINPQSLLDVGMGLGKFGVLAREYLEMRQMVWQKAEWQRRIDGIESFAPYHSPLHDFVYDHTWFGEAQAIIPTLTQHYDLALLIDVLEHFEPTAGREFLRALQARATNLLISTPLHFFAQPAAFGNPREAHRSHWVPTDFTPLGPTCFIPNDYSLICVLGPASAQVARELFTLRRQLQRHLPVVLRGYRALKKWWPFRH